MRRAAHASLRRGAQHGVAGSVTARVLLCYSHRGMLQHTALFLHLISFAGYAGAGFAQQRLVAMSAADGIASPVRDAYERLAATIVTKIELPAIFLSLFSGILFLVYEPAYLKQAAWFHPKMTCVLLLLILSHLEMFNARRIVRARVAGGADADIAKRKKRHGIFGMAGGVLVVIILVLVSFVRTA